ncbi:uncharacterized protein PHALS_08562 [Plasmopara halstedii]|uniref:Uncharacterized protein n=1 Tax=Plasmopara halstedii TaxID=4781 RepID=A0A0N7L4F0_PLAHL|nr:uncharacterized protein PHALS_08562 [Plasmopara halstedii]CEG38491.1 hypothetical protein PHALS_08562 [Plasmopara halstedii]|eukprot:XP_024574860.1 hypothetical protein PHALS_08562 [Plasmopara halstedii]
MEPLLVPTVPKTIRVQEREYNNVDEAVVIDKRWTCEMHQEEQQCASEKVGLEDKDREDLFCVLPIFGRTTIGRTQILRIRTRNIFLKVGAAEVRPTRRCVAVIVQPSRHELKSASRLDSYKYETAPTFD